VSDAGVKRVQARGERGASPESEGMSEERSESRVAGGIRGRIC
jgi:hypothetical protein